MDQILLQNKIKELELELDLIKTSQKSRANDILYNGILEQATDFILLTTIDGIFLDVNVHFCQTIGYSKEELLSMKIDSLVDPIEISAQPLDVEGVKSGMSILRERTLISKSGKRIEIEANTKMLADGRVLAIARDISIKKLTAMELSKNEEKFRNLLNKLDSGVVVHSADTSIINSNPKAAELLGITEDQMKGKVAIDSEWNFLNEDGTIMIHENYPAFQIKKNKTVLKKFIGGVNRPLTKDIVWLEVTGYPVFDEQQELIEIVISFIDITELHEAQISLRKAKDRAEENERDLLFKNNAFEKINHQLKERNTELSMASMDISKRKVTEAALQKKTEELARVNAELEHFAYVASHDLQEPLRTISNFVGMLNKKFSEKSDEERQYLKFILGATTKMQRLILALLEFSRIGRKSMFSEVDCDEVLIEVLSEISISIQESKATINAQKLPKVIGNELELKQLFQNLISNAIKFRRPEIPPIIELFVEENDMEYLFSIKDNGIGIEEKYQEKVFVIFQRLHIDSQYQGTGIGLATCQKIVNQHNGKIWIESESGVGTTIFFTISKENKI